MGQNFVASLKAEIDDLENSLRLDVRYIRLIELKKILDLYSHNASFSPSSSNATVRGEEWAAIVVDRSRNSDFTSEENIDASVSSRSTGRRSSPEKSRAIEAVALHLANRVGPVPTRDLLDHIADLGIEIGGTIPVNNLSAMLSNSEQFESHGRSGWTLKKKKTAQQLSLEAMEQAVIQIISDLSDESLAGIQGYLREFANIPENILESLHVAYEEIMNTDVSSIESRRLRTLFEHLLGAEIDNRSSGFTRD